MEMSSWRYLFRAVAGCAAAASVIVAAALYPHLPSTIPTSVSNDGTAHGAQPAIAIFLPAVLVLVAFALLNYAPRMTTASLRMNERAGAAMWFTASSAFALVVVAQLAIGTAAMHPGLPPLQWPIAVLVPCTLGGALLTAFLTYRRRGET